MVDNHPPQPPTSAEGQPNEPFVKLFLANEPRVYAFILSVVVNRADADEVFQETGLTAWSKFSEFTPGTDFLAWACRIAQNKVMNLNAKRGRSAVLFDSEFVALVATERLARTDELDARYAALVECLEKLRSADRTLLERSCRSGTTIKTLAEQLGRPADTLYKSLRRIRKLLHECVHRTLAREDRS
jgi:RNA polymerase sigma-70 factor (ECF subfamily)